MLGRRPGASGAAADLNSGSVEITEHEARAHLVLILGDTIGGQFGNKRERANGDN